MDANQLGRRNLTPDNFKWILGRRYNRTKKSHGGDRKGSISRDQNDPLAGRAQQKHTTAQSLAEEHGVGEATVKRAGKFAEEVENTPELKQAMEQGKSQREVAKDVGVDEKTVRNVVGAEKRKTCENPHLEPEPFTRGLNSFALHPEPEDTRPSTACWTPAEVDPADREPMTLPSAGSPPWCA